MGAVIFEELFLGIWNHGMRPFLFLSFLLWDDYVMHG